MVPELVPNGLVSWSGPRERLSGDGASFNGWVSRLDHVDLSLHLSREEEARLAAAQRRLLHLRLALPAPDQPRGHGLDNMQVRAARRNGVFDIRPADPQVTVVEWRVPVK
jgi:hypothetical protein